MSNFAAYNVAFEIVKEMKPIIDGLRRHSAEAADQAERATISLLFNIAEGNRRHGRDPIRFFVIAQGSAAEIQAALDLADAWGWRLDDERARTLLDRERGILWGLTHPKPNRNRVRSSPA